MASNNALKRHKYVVVFNNLFLVLNFQNQSGLNYFPLFQIMMNMKQRELKI